MPRRILSLIIFIALGTALACGGGADDSARPSDSDDIKLSPAAGNGAAAEPTRGPEQSAGSFGNVADEPVRFETADGVVIQGHLYSAEGPKRKVVVLAHELPTDQTAWRDFAREMASRGIHALTFDFRGYGETGGQRDVSKIDRDLEYAVRFIRSRDYAQVYVIGASMGGTAALKVASRLEVAGVVTLSAPPEIMGLDARQDVAKVTEPALFIAGQRDAGGAYVQAAQAFSSAAGSARKATEFYDSGDHGTALLKGSVADEVKAALIAFLEAN
jgi:alpha-beta hydrolase superfamily lysophospholipase